MGDIPLVGAPPPFEVSCVSHRPEYAQSVPPGPWPVPLTPDEAVFVKICDQYHSSDSDTRLVLLGTWPATTSRTRALARPDPSRVLRDKFIE